MIMISSDTSKH